MRFAIIAPPTQTKKWKIEFEKQAPNEDLLIGYKTDRPEEIECVMVWGHPKGSLEKFKNLKLIFSMGAGVDHILNDDTIPKNIPISRIVDPQMAFSMTNYILMAVLNYQRCWYDFQDAQKKNHWAQFEFDEKGILLNQTVLTADNFKKIAFSSDKTKVERNAYGITDQLYDAFTRGQ